MKATSVPAIEQKSALTPSSNFDGNDTRKSISLKCDERIDKNSNIDVEEDSSAIASDMKNTLNQTLFNKIFQLSAGCFAYRHQHRLELLP